MVEATAYANDIAKQENEDALAKVKASGKSELITLTPEQKAEWKKKLVEVHRQMEDRVGKELIQSIYKETGSDASKL
jgi:C4-dicarboxylate-binding protein DctP